MTNNNYALLIGINYYNSDDKLNGCINDMLMIRRYLIHKKRYLSENIICMSEKDEDETLIPTYYNIIEQLENLINKANNNITSEIFFYYSGHGNNIACDLLCMSNFISIIMPSDYNFFKYISNYQLSNIISKLNSLTKMYCIFDCCHSGSIINLQYTYKISNNKLTLSDNTDININLLNKKIISITSCDIDEYSLDIDNAYYSNEIINDTFGGLFTSNLLKIIFYSNYQLEDIFLHFNISDKYQNPTISSSIQLNYFIN